MIQRPRGTLDILPENAVKRVFVENKIREIFTNFNYQEIRTPSFEMTSLFKRSIGEETDVVSKEMYSFNNDKYTLKPEMTAPVIRAYIENSLFSQSPINKLFYIAKMYRHENPQAGRYREFTQFGAEAIGSSDFTIDAEMISLSVRILNEFGIKDIVTKINTIGTIEERKEYIAKLKDYLNKYYKDLSSDSKRRLETNPLRILDSKLDFEIDILNGAPVLFDFLNETSKEHFNKVLEALTGFGIKCEVDYKLVRGFDYYTSTTFEVISNDLGAQNAVLGGGRYDTLVEQLGGNPTPAIGFASGVERLMMLLEKLDYKFPEPLKLKLYIVTIGEEAKKFAAKKLFELRKKNIKCDTDYLNRSVKAQMREANKLNSEYTLVLGENEIKSGQAQLKKMIDGEIINVALDNIENLIVEKI
ncbi:MAG TPA: histidine--tRNA ligase [Ignavibacteria bacterium]